MSAATFWHEAQQVLTCTECQIYTSKDVPVLPVTPTERMFCLYMLRRLLNSVRVEASLLCHMQSLNWHSSLYHFHSRSSLLPVGTSAMAGMLLPWPGPRRREL